MSLSTIPHLPLPPARQSAFDQPNFVNDTTEKMAYYYIAFQRCMDRVRSRFDSVETMTPHWKSAERAWHADPHTNPTVFPPGPLTLENLHDFYRKCDNLLNVDSTTSTTQLIHAIFAANNGAQFIDSMLISYDPQSSTAIARKAGDIAQNVLLTPAQKQAIFAGTDSSVPTERVGPGDILRYADIQDPNIIHSVLIKDHGSSAMRGEYFVVTTILDEDDDGSHDQEVPNDMMAEWVSLRVP